MAAFVALIRKEPRSDYGVDFPDFPGCVSAGRTIDEAVAMAHEALGGHVAMMVEEGREAPGSGPPGHDPERSAQQGRGAVSRLRARRGAMSLLGAQPTVSGRRRRVAAKAWKLQRAS